jgi:parallel beta-helix repeat protein
MSTRPVHPRWLACALLLWAPLASQAATAPLTIVVGPVSPLPPGAQAVARLMDVAWSTLPPGSEVIVGPGQQAGPVTITAQGTAAQPIVVHASAGQPAPVITSSVDFQGAAHVKFKGMVVQDSPWSAVVIRYGSHHLTIAGNTLQRSEMGLSITAGAGTGHKILNNLIQDNRTVGLGIDTVNAAPDDRGRITGNLIQRSGHHGIELNGSNYLIERNVTARNGLAIGGTSGIHIYSRNASEDSGDHNTVRYNFAYEQQDRTAWDGNGIQIDQWCDGNEVSHNVAWANDGAGIIVFDGANNRVSGNTVVGNQRDPRRWLGNAGELVISTSGPHEDRSSGNLVFNNLLVSTRADIPALFVDHLTADNNNQLGPNLLYNTTQSWLLQRGAQMSAAAEDLDRITGQAGNLAQAPDFADVQQPLAHGLRLLRTPAAKGQFLQGSPDMLGTKATRRDSLFGAYYTLPGL